MIKGSFEIFDRFFNSHWFLTGHVHHPFTEVLRLGSNKSISKFIGVIENDVTLMIFDFDEFDQAARFYAIKLMNDVSWRKRMYKKHDYFLRKYFAYGEHLRRLNFNNRSDKQLVSEIRKIIPLQEQVRIFGITLNGLVLDGRNHFSDKLRQEMRRFMLDDDQFDKHWSFLTQVTKLSMRQKKEMAIAKLVLLAKRKSKGWVQRKLQSIYEKYCWLDYMYYGPPIPFEQFKSDLSTAIKHNKNLKLRQELSSLARKQKLLMKKLHFNKRAMDLVNLAQLILWHKGWRKDIEYHGFYCYEPLFREIARRKGVSDWRTLLFMLPKEVEGFILRNKPSISMLTQRRIFSCLIASDKKVAILVGRRARQFYKSLGLENHLQEMTEVKGQCAFSGRAKGIVRIVQVPEDIYKMQKGNILVSQATSPDLLPAIRKAAAIVTNTGGLICHAAIISRELRIPCVVGTAKATLVFKDGDLVEVDANKGIVHLVSGSRRVNKLTKQ